MVLAFRQALVLELDLPLNPDEMLYERIADVTEADIGSARAHVSASQSAATLALSMIDREFWTEYLEQMHPSKFKLPKRFRTRLAALAPGAGYEEASRNLQAQVDAWRLEQRLDLTLDGLRRATWGWKVQVKW